MGPFFTRLVKILEVLHLPIPLRYLISLVRAFNYVFSSYEVSVGND